MSLIWRELFSKSTFVKKKKKPGMRSWCFEIKQINLNVRNLWEKNFSQFKGKKDKKIARKLSTALKNGKVTKIKLMLTIQESETILQTAP